MITKNNPQELLLHTIYILGAIMLSIGCSHEKSRPRSADGTGFESNGTYNEIRELISDGGIVGCSRTIVELGPPQIRVPISAPSAVPTRIPRSASGMAMEIEMISEVGAMVRTSVASRSYRRRTTRSSPYESLRGMRVTYLHR